jgi:elongation factor P--(R)-beta-lysine ligase
MAWLQTASPKTLALRARILARIREFFATRGVLEVETPALSHAGATDPALENIPARVSALGDAPVYLHTSPELAMKRLLVAGSGDIYQICRVFRDGELGRWHQPEFMMLEWYRRDYSETELMTEVEALIGAALAEGGRGVTARSITYRAAFAAELGIDPFAALEPLRAALHARGIDVPSGLTANALLDLALSTAVAASFPKDTLTFVYDYPAAQAALAQIKATEPPVAARFEAFVGPLELANGFRELTDADEQQARFEADIAARHRAGRPAAPVDADFLAALRTGLPPCAGVALGLDRLVALAAGLTNVAEAMTFGHVG